MFDVPYRWGWKTTFSNFSHIAWNIRHGIGNIIRWVPVIWRDRDYDWEYLAHVMEFKLRRMALDAQTWQTVYAPEHRDEMLECADIIHRLRNEDDYYYPNKPNPKKRDYLACIRRQRNDLKRLGKIIGSRLNFWWY